MGFRAQNNLAQRDAFESSWNRTKYSYDLLGRRNDRYEVVMPYQEQAIYVWDGAHIIAEYTGSSLTKKYIYGQIKSETA